MSDPAPSPVSPELLTRARGEHFRLIWLAGATSGETSRALARVAAQAGGRVVNLGQVLSAALLDVPPALRPASVDEAFAACLADVPEPVCLDHLDILFEPSLRVNPVALVQNASRHRLLVVAWPGSTAADRLVYGPPGHPAHHSLAEKDLESPVVHLYSEPHP